MKNEIKKKKGFTLIELLVAITVFTIMIGSVVALFGNAIQAQDQVLLQAQTLNSTSYVFEYMAKALRMAKKDLSGGCIPINNNFINVGNETVIRFLNYDNKCQEFGLTSGVIYMRKSTNNLSSGLSSEIPLSDSALSVTGLSFVISGNDQEDEFQPKVTLAADMKSLRSKFPSFKVQTTVSQRDLDVPR